MRWIGRGLIIVLALGLGLSLPTLFPGEAYTAFRYAANLAGGEGLAYNPPDAVPGFASPLFTLMLAALARLGMDMETAAQVLGLLCHALLCLVVFDAAGLLLPEGSPHRFETGLLAGAACCLNPRLALIASDGTETSLVCALMLATLVGARRRGAVAAGVCFGLALLARPDAVIVAAPAVWFLSGDRSAGPARRTAMFAGSAGLVLAPWLVFSIGSFGTPVPRWLSTGGFIRPVALVQVLDVYFLAAAPLALLAVVSGRRNPFVTATAGLVALVAAASFAWSAEPMIPAWLMLAAAGAAGLLRRPTAWRGAAWALVIVMIVGISAVDLRSRIPGLADAWDEWEGAYEIAARWIMADSKPGDTVYTGDAGVLGYLLPQRRIIDSSGFHSSGIGPRGNDPAWATEMVRTLEPEYIAVPAGEPGIAALSRQAWFRASYRRARLPLVEAEGQTIYRRVDGE